MDKIHYIGISSAVLFIVLMVILGIQSRKKKPVKSSRKLKSDGDGLPHGRPSNNSDYW